MSYSGNIKVHGPDVPEYYEQPNIYVSAYFGDVTRDGDYIYCDVSLSLNAMTRLSWFGYQVHVYAQLDGDQIVELVNKPNSPRTWNSDVYKGSARLQSWNNTSSCKITVYFMSNCPCPGKNKQVAVWSSDFWCPSREAPSLNLYSTGYSYNYLSWQVDSNQRCKEWSYRLDGGEWHSYDWTTSTSSTGSLEVSPSWHRVVVAGLNEYNIWGYSSELYWDCTIPSITNYSITPINNTTGVLKFTTNYNVYYYFNGVYSGEGNGDISINVTLTENTAKNYELRVSRTDNTSIGSSVNVWADTTYPKLALYTSVNGLEVSYTCYADPYCKDWVMYYSWTDEYGVSHTESIQGPKEAWSWSGTFTGLPNVGYYFTVYATKTSNNATGYSNTSGAKPTGCARIYDRKGTPITAGVYIWTNNSWKSAVPYVWSNGQWNMAK